jgi:hypothetical protein
MMNNKQNLILGKPLQAKLSDIHPMADSDQCSVLSSYEQEQIFVDKKKLTHKKEMPGYMRKLEKDQTPKKVDPAKTLKIELAREELMKQEIIIKQMKLSN